MRSSSQVRLGGLIWLGFTVVAVVGFRMGAARSCNTGNSSEGWFSQVISRRLLDARETLRATRTFGPLVNELFPIEVMAGEMMAPPPAPAP